MYFDHTYEHASLMNVFLLAFSEEHCILTSANM